MNLNEIKPVGPHVEGFIRFASEGTADNRKQLDHFEVLSRVHEENSTGDKRLALHPIMEKLAPLENGERKPLKIIPIKLMFNSVENNLSGRYEAYDNQIGRLVCSGDGKAAMRKSLTTGEAAAYVCPGPDVCNYANSQGVTCQLNVRLKVQLEGQSDPFSVFEFQSGGINTYRALSSKLSLIRAGFGGKLRHVPLQLTIWEKSSPLSLFEPFYCADVKLREEQNPKTIKSDLAKAEAEEIFDVQLLEDAATAMRANVEPLMDDSSIIITYTPRQKARVARNTEPAGFSSGLAGVVAAAKNSAQEGCGAVDRPAADDRLVPEKVTTAGPQSTETGDLPANEVLPVVENVAQEVSASVPAGANREMHELPPTAL